MSLSDVAASQDSPDSSTSTTVSFESPVVPLHSLHSLHSTLISDPTASDPIHPLSLHSKQQQNSADAGSSPQTPPGASLNHSPLDHQTDGLPLIPVAGEKCMEVDDNDEEGGVQIPEGLALLLERRNRQPRPGALRVMKPVRIRKGSSSSKSRTKKYALRVQLKDAARIEEEMAEYRGRCRGKKDRPISERRPPVTESGSSSRGRPSGLRFSESCYSDKEDQGCQCEEDGVVGTPERNSGVSTQQSPNHQSNPDVSSTIE